MKISREEFNNHNGHYLNWYVYRSPAIRKTLKLLWQNSNRINKVTMQGANLKQKIVKSVNVLFRNMENNGPERTEFSKYRYDKRNDLYHAHMSNGKLTYVVMWEADTNKRIINIVSMGNHENFKFKRKHNKNHAIKKIELNQSKDKKYLQYLKYQKKRQSQVLR